MLETEVATTVLPSFAESIVDLAVALFSLAKYTVEEDPSTYLW